MQKQEFDMEVTEYRGKMIWETLAMLYADQQNVEVKSITYPNKNRVVTNEARCSSGSE